MPRSAEIAATGDGRHAGFATLDASANGRSRTRRLALQLRDVRRAGVCRRRRHASRGTGFRNVRLQYVRHRGMACGQSRPVGTSGKNARLSCEQRRGVRYVWGACHAYEERRVCFTPWRRRHLVSDVASPHSQRNNAVTAILGHSVAVYSSSRRRPAVDGRWRPPVKVERRRDHWRPPGPAPALASSSSAARAHTS